ncbi:cytochrome P450 [Amanita rubescens]|nr:cytochrome P450 [Amanita rubescens]
MSFSLLLLPAFLLIILRLYLSPRFKYPPGPRPLPLLGNVLDVPVERPEERFAEWGFHYGDLVYIRLFQQPVLILNSLRAAREILEQRGAIYSDRPRFVLFSELMGWASASTHVRYGPRFRKHRRFVNLTFNQRATARLQPLQVKETFTLVGGFMQEPKLFIQHFRRFAAATILKITYGREITSVEDPFVLLAERAGTLTVESGSPAATLVDYFPIIRHIPTWAPFAGFKRRALEARKAVEKMMDVPFELVKEDLRTGHAVPSYTSTLLEAHRKPDGKVDLEDEYDIKGSAGTLYAAAAETTVAVLETFMLAMTRQPHILVKAQEEMDRVVGTERLPDLEDRASLSYLECIFNEVLRWNPPVPLGLPHRLMEDDFYGGYFIPKGSNVLANIHAILHDCPQPNEFNPDRYLIDNDLPNPKDVVFGFGRRICPGRHFADSGMWIVISHIVALFRIAPVVNDDGKIIVPPVSFATGFVRHCKPFPCTIEPRNEKAYRLYLQSSAQWSN